METNFGRTAMKSVFRTELESDDERKHRRLAVSHGWFVEKIMRTARNGFPDRFYAKRSRIVLIEFKKGNRPLREQQKLRHRELKRAGVEVYVARSIEEANEILGINV